MHAGRRLSYGLIAAGLVLLGIVAGVLLSLPAKQRAQPATTTVAARPPAPAGPLTATPVAPGAVRIVWKGGGRAAVGLTGQPPTIWVSGGDVTLGGLSFTASYDVRAGSSTVTVSPSEPTGAVTGSVGDGVVLLDGQPFFPILLWGQCPSYDPLLALGIDVFMNNPCGGIEAQVGALAGKGLSVAEAPGASGAGVIGSYYPDEADGHGYTGASLPAAQGLRFLTLTNHFYSAAAPLPAGKTIYPGLVAKADVVGFDLYPLQVWCRRNALPDVAAAQRELVRLAAGRPTFQWIETTHMQCPSGDRALAVTPATVRAESWLALIGGAHGLGFFPIGWTGDVSGALAQMGHDIQALGPVLLQPEAPVSAAAPLEATARSYGGAFYVFAVNPTYAPVTATISAPGLDGRPLEVLGESRNVTPANGAFADEFAPLAVHLYVAAPG
ncbi:MAG TPA: hypothetical protein VMT59_13450 [Gaiellaceae bacterium]|nr:hypothetical protein [Gaiellaceae bacterium]